MKDRKDLSVSLENSLWEKLEQVCEENGLSYSEVARRGILQQVKTLEENP